MLNNYNINITGRETIDGMDDGISLFTVGDYKKTENGYLISYMDTETTGFAGDITTLETNGNKSITIRRRGKSFMDLVVEKDRRNVSHYDTEFGSMLVGVHGNDLRINLDDSGGTVSFRYALDIDTNIVSEHSLDITVKEGNRNVQ